MRQCFWLQKESLTRPLDKERDLIIIRTNVQLEVAAMNDTHHFALTLETLAELAPEIRSAHADPAPALPKLSTVLSKFSPLPREALFLGVANDGLPVLLNLRDPVPGPVLIVGDSGSGKTRLLQIIAQAIDHGYDPENIRYTVMTERTKEWERFDQSANCEGVLLFRQPLTTNYVTSLVEWAHSNKHEQQFVLLLVDGLEALAGDIELHQAFRWLLLRGPSRRIWSIVTLNATQATTASQWLGAFRTRLYGHIASERDIKAMTGSADFSFNDLLAGSQFTLHEGKAWLSFWLPTLD